LGVQVLQNHSLFGKAVQVGHWDVGLSVDARISSAEVIQAVDMYVGISVFDINKSDSAEPI
jgi:hypothetical protein